MRIHVAICTLPLLMLGLASCAAVPETEAAHRVPDPNRFEQLPTKSSVEIYRRTGASLKAYDKILLRPLQIELRSGWYPERDAPKTHDIHQARKRIASIFETEMTNVLESSGRYDVVPSPAADVLELRPQIIDLYVKAVDDEVSDSSVQTYEIHDSELTLTGDLRDSMTGTVLYRFYDHRSTAIGTLMSSSAEARGEELRRLVGEWAQKLRDTLDLAHQE